MLFLCIPRRRFPRLPIYKPLTCVLHFAPFRCLADSQTIFRRRQTSGASLRVPNWQIPKSHAAVLRPLPSPLEWYPSPPNHITHVLGLSAFTLSPPPLEASSARLHVVLLNAFRLSPAAIWSPPGSLQPPNKAYPSPPGHTKIPSQIKILRLKDSTDFLLALWQQTHFLLAYNFKRAVPKQHFVPKTLHTCNANLAYVQKRIHI